MAVPKTMRAAQVVEFNKPYQINEVPVPTDLGPYDILAKVAVASLCHTDSMVTAGVMGTPLPTTGSHEGAGTVVSMGSEVKEFKVGDRVLFGVQFHMCGECKDCRESGSQSQYCSNSKACGISVDGSFAEYQVIDARRSSIIPDNVTFETAAPLACAGVTIYGALKKADVPAGQWIALVGAGGGLGHLGVMFAKAMGLKVIGIDARDEGLKLAKDSGADVVIDARQGLKGVVKEVKAAAGQDGVTASINISDARSAAATACAITRTHGKMIQTSQPDEVVIPFRELVFRDIKVEGSLIANKAEQQEMLELVSKHNIITKTNAFHGLDEISDLIELAHGENGVSKMAGKGIVIMDQEAVQRAHKI